jgi:hypothetical protein
MLRRHAASAALLMSIFALVISTTGIADAARKKVSSSVVRLVHGKIPTRYLPTAARAKTADRLSGTSLADLTDGCPADTMNLGTWCLMNATYGVSSAEQGKNDYFFATQKCVELGGWLPTAAQLVGAAKKAKLSSTIGDDIDRASVDVTVGDGLKDQREMTATLVTTAAGSSAAGSEGVSDGSRGDARTGEPNPVPVPANPDPSTLQYVTIYDNHDQGGFAGSAPISQPERFRCGFDRTQPVAAATD